MATRRSTRCLQQFCLNGQFSSTHLSLVISGGLCGDQYQHAVLHRSTFWVSKSLSSSMDHVYSGGVIKLSSAIQFPTEYRSHVKTAGEIFCFGIFHQPMLRYNSGVDKIVKVTT